MLMSVGMVSRLVMPVTIGILWHVLGLQAMPFGALADLPTSLSGLHSADQWRWIPFFAGMDAISSWAHDARYS